MRGTLALFPLFPLLVAFAGCAPQRSAEFERSFAEARRAESAGRFAEAATKYDQASNQAKRPRDKARMHYEAAVLLARAGNAAEATRRFDALATEKPPSDYAPNAALRAAEIRLTHSEAPAAIDAFEALIVSFPNSGSSFAALSHLVRTKDESAAAGEGATAAYLSTLLPKVKGSLIEERVIYERAKRLEAGDMKGAHALYLEIADRFPYPRGVYFDDALYRAAEIDQKLGAYKEAVDHLERLLAERETSHMIGSYERPKYSSAALKIAEIYATNLHDNESAKRAYHRVYSEFKTSILRDDALFREATLYAAENDKSGQCSVLSTLVSNFADSKYVPCAEATCPSIKRAETSKAPKSCHAAAESISSGGSAPAESTK